MAHYDNSEREQVQERLAALITHYAKQEDEASQCLYDIFEIASLSTAGIESISVLVRVAIEDFHEYCANGDTRVLASVLEQLDNFDKALPEDKEAAAREKKEL